LKVKKTIENSCTFCFTIHCCSATQFVELSLVLYSSLIQKGKRNSRQNDTT
jgi:hypothetical protein